MATRRTTRRVYTYTARTWMFQLSFWLVVIIGAAMAFVGILTACHVSWGWFNSFAYWVESICFAIGMFIPVIMSYQVARHKGTLWFVLWIIFVVLVVVGLVTNIIGHF